MPAGPANCGPGRHGSPRLAALIAGDSGSGVPGPAGRSSLAAAAALSGPEQPTRTRMRAQGYPSGPSSALRQTRPGATRMVVLQVWREETPVDSDWEDPESTVAPPTRSFKFPGGCGEGPGGSGRPSRAPASASESESE